MAIGETGLDYYWDAAPHAAQAEAFAWHIDLAKRLGKPLMIHDRDAHADVLAILRSEGAPETVIFHCFSGDVAMARVCADAGLPPVLRRSGQLPQRHATSPRRQTLVPAELLMVETDAPFLTPHPHRGKRNEPYALPYTVRALAAIRARTLESCAQQVTSTTRRVYSLPDLRNDRGQARSVPGRSGSSR